ncbi:hypothetical protein G6F46_006368 [Rhizopus delemar]|nr:hypothetical protein G6F55_008773 [Rhizopus delemar]KAG1548759.1 hypothetical protein G6F51_003469 [Rhizopus arrhizus]KAG1500161.1 hypothetical protein G6F54_003904 [Rhizopus delemar]KAG1511361.1 hypothetical protein G6F53_005997 [Rhizopus delemar]KAG1526064.1 hypothetical protein G6F52_002767 [Rhizopus delemar]
MNETSLIENPVFYTLNPERAFMASDRLYPGSNHHTLSHHRSHNDHQAVHVATWAFIKHTGYCSLVTLLMSLLAYWYKRYKEQKREVQLKRSHMSLLDLPCTFVTPPRSPINSTSSLSFANNTSSRHGSSWRARLMEGVMSAAGMKKKMTISLKNTVLWNPSRDIQLPNHAFQENAIRLLIELSTAYDMYVMIHMNTDQDRNQIDQLMTSAHLFDTIDRRKVLYCSSEEGKVQLIHQIDPVVHVEGGWELDDGKKMMERLSVDRVIWILANQKKRVYYEQCYEKIEISDHILNTSIAKSVGFYTQ